MPLFCSLNLQNVLKRQYLIYLAALAETQRLLALFVTCLILSVCLHRCVWWKSFSLQVGGTKPVTIWYKNTLYTRSVAPL